MTISKADIVSLLVEVRTSLPDALALKYAAMYPHWAPDIDITQDMIDKGKNRYQHGGRLHKTITPHKTQEGWEPGQTTASVWTVIDVEHEGTLADPIPYSLNMEVYQNKYYTYEGVLYICTRDSGIALQHTPAELIGHYFELA